MVVNPLDASFEGEWQHGIERVAENVLILPGVGKRSYFSAVLTIAFLFFLSVLPFASALLFFILFFLLVGKYYLYLLILSIAKQSLKQGELLCDLVLTRCLRALLCSASHRKKEER